MKVKSNVKSGADRIMMNHSQALKGLRVRSGVKAGGVKVNHSQSVAR
jgi:hypothetical protein